MFITNCVFSEYTFSFSIFNTYPNKDLDTQPDLYGLEILDIGKVMGAESIKFSYILPNHYPNFPISLEVKGRAKPVAEDLINKGLLVHCSS